MSYRSLPIATHPQMRFTPVGPAVLVFVALFLFFAGFVLPCAPALAGDSGYSELRAARSSDPGELLRVYGGYGSHLCFEDRYYPEPDGWSLSPAGLRSWAL